MKAKTFILWFFGLAAAMPMLTSCSDDDDKDDGKKQKESQPHYLLKTGDNAYVKVMSLKVDGYFTAYNVVWGQNNLPTDIADYKQVEENVYVDTYTYNSGKTDEYTAKRTRTLTFVDGSNRLARIDKVYENLKTKDVSEGAIIFTYDNESRLIRVQNDDKVYELKWSDDKTKIMSIGSVNFFYSGDKPNPLRTLNMRMIYSFLRSNNSFENILCAMGCFGQGPVYLPTSAEYPIGDVTGRVAKITFDTQLNSDGTMRRFSETVNLGEATPSSSTYNFTYQPYTPSN